MSNQNRVPRGVSQGGQFSQSARGEAGVGLTVQHFDCVECAADPVRRDDPDCAWCDGGKVTADRFGQYPWTPDRPGTRVAFEVMQGDTPMWKEAVVTAMADPRYQRTDDRAPAYVMTIPAGGPEAFETRVRSTLPVPAAQAAARRGVSQYEMMAEAASVMPGDIDPNHNEVATFLHLADEDALDEIATAAAQYRPRRATELREASRTGPALDKSYDVSALPTGTLDRAVAAAQAGFPAQFEIVDRDNWHGYTLVAKSGAGRVAVYSDSAWDRPGEDPTLPWHPPVGTPVAHVALDGTVTRIDQKDPS